MSKLKILILFVWFSYSIGIFSQLLEPKVVVIGFMDAIKANKESIQWVDLQGLGQQCLGEYWKSLSESQAQEFMNVFQKLFEEIAFPKSSKFFSDYEIEVVDVIVANNEATVKTSIDHPDEGIIDIDYQLKQVNDEWLVADVSLDGVSLVLDLKSQMMQIIKDESFNALLDRMKEKLAVEGSKD